MKTQALVLYRLKPALVVEVGEKLTINLPDGSSLKVRDKDVEPLHPGPLASLNALVETPVNGLAEAVELLGGAETTLADLTALLFDKPGPSETWAVWTAVFETWYEGLPSRLVPIAPEVREKRRLEAEAKQARQKEWEASLSRLAGGTWSETERPLLQEVEAFALGKQAGSRVLKALGKKETPETAHHLLLHLGFWKPDRDPWPERMGLRLSTPQILLGNPDLSGRLDLREIPAFAIDDEGNRDPDDAIAWDGERLWVHVADAAHLVEPGSPADMEARERGATLYLPWKIAPMLPESAVEHLGLGLQKESPALSFGMRLNAEGNVADVQIIPTLVRVTRLSYQDADDQRSDRDLASLRGVVRASADFRLRQGAFSLNLPEVKIYWEEGRVRIVPVPPLESRQTVTEAMLLAGQAAALWAENEALPFAYSQQDEPEGEAPKFGGLAQDWALRKLLKKAVFSASPVPHAGLGLSAYSQVTSPLRRYLDLTLHQQIRRRLATQEPISYDEMARRILMAEEALAKNRKCERSSRLHFTLLWHLQNPDWVGEAVVVDVQGNQSTVIVPQTALETKMNFRSPPELNQVLLVKAKDISLPSQTVSLVLAN